jgi:hypothetical protein
VTSSLVIAGRLILLLLAGVATVWAFAFSGERDPAPGGAGEHVHVHGASARGSAEPDHVASGSEEQGHAHHGAGEREHAASGSGPAASQEFAVAESANPQDHKVIGAAGRRIFALSVRAPAWLETRPRSRCRNDSKLCPATSPFFRRWPVRHRRAMSAAALGRVLEGPSHRCARPGLHQAVGWRAATSTQAGHLWRATSPGTLSQ